MELMNNKVYRFSYTDADGRDRGRRTALHLGGNCVRSLSPMGSRFLDLDKGEYRNFVPARMAKIQQVDCEVGYVDVSNLPPNLVDATVKTFRDSGFTVFRDFPHINAVKDWQAKKPPFHINKIRDNGFYCYVGDRRVIADAGSVLINGALNVWDRDQWKSHTDPLETIKTLHRKLGEVIQAAEATG